MLNLIISILILSSALHGYSQVDKNTTKSGVSANDSLLAVFTYKLKSGYAGISIELHFNKTFTYLAGSDLEQSFSNGIWEFRKDTLILKSGLDKNNIPLLIREYKGEKKDSLSIAWMTNQNDEVVKDVMFFYNDSIQNCMPVFDECRFRSGTIKRIKAVFSNNLSSRWYTIKDAAVTYIEPVLPLDFSLDKYIFLKNKKFLLKKGGLYELKEVKKKIKGKYRSTLIRNTSVFYERSK